jgi:dTDP-4-dehydrorhamnose 3,5-epimerase
VKVTPTDLPEVLRIEPHVFPDARGFFLETYRAARYRECGIDPEFVQDNHSRSTLGTIRGLHAQRGTAKLVRAVRGSVFDVAVDIRVGSPRFGRYVAVTLSEDNFEQLYIPAGFAHGFAVTSDVGEIEYKCSAVYSPEAEIAIAWNDPQIAIAWPVENPVLSERDRAAHPLAAMAARCPRFEG